MTFAQQTQMTARPNRRAPAVEDELDVDTNARERATLLDLRGYCAGYSDHKSKVALVENLNLTLAEGEILALVGESGAGKTATCNSLIAMNGLWRTGSALFQGEDLATATDRRVGNLRGRHIGMIPQQPMSSLNPVMSIGQHFASLLAKHRGLRGAAARTEAIGLLREVDLPEPELRLGQYAHEFSGGMAQRIAIALALASEPKVLFADEPTTALDVTLRDQILLLLRGLARKRGMGLILITHDFSAVEKAADRVAVLYAGRLVEEGPVRALMEQPRHPYSAALLAARPRIGQFAKAIPGQQPPPRSRPEGCGFAARCAKRSAACQTAPVLESAGSKRRVACWHPVEKEAVHTATAPAVAAAREAAVSRDETVISARDLICAFPVGPRRLFGPRPMRHAVDRVSFDLHRGGALGLVGESGCGKSTLARMIAGLVRPSAGNLHVDGADLTRPLDRRAHALRAQMVFQNPLASLDPRLPVVAQVAEPLRAHGRKNQTAALEEALNALSALGLDAETAQKTPKRLSGGQQQRVVIARALILNPKILICDEPTSALDVSVQAETLSLLNRLRLERQLTLLFISHDLAAVAAVADEIAVMEQGKFVEVGPADRLLAQPAHALTKALIASSRDGALTPGGVS